MAQTVTQTFRQTFKVPKDLIKWYPGHMRNGMLQMQAKLKSVDCVVEVHDARIALSGRNPNFLKNLLGIKPHILVLNKSDLIYEQDFNSIKQKLKKDGTENIIFTNCRNYKSCKGVAKLVPTAIKLISSLPRYNRREEIDLNMMIIGIPNVGKSSLINALRMKNLQRSPGTRVGPIAGVTTSVLNKIRVHVRPNMFLIDTPGILPPNISNTETALKLASCACLKDSIVGSEVIADYLLYWLNKSGNFIYVNTLNLDGPKDNIIEVLCKVAVMHNLAVTVKDLRTNSFVKMPNFEQAANIMLDMFRTGKFGLINLDSDLLHFENSNQVCDSSQEMR